MSSALGGCGSCERTGYDAIDFSEGSVVGDVYQTSPPDGLWLHFPAGRRFRFQHGLGVVPEVSAYVAMNERPMPSGARPPESVGNVSEAAGNEVIIERQDANVVQVRNDTCAEYYLRVVARRP